MKLNEIKWEDGRKYRDNAHDITWVVKEIYGFHLVNIETDEPIEDMFYINQLINVEFEEVE